MNKVKSKEENERKQKGLAMWASSSSQSETQTSGTPRIRNSFSSCRCLPFRLSKSSLHLPYHCTTVLHPASYNPRSAESCSRISEIRQIFRTYDVARVGAIPNLQLDLFSSSHMNDGNKIEFVNWIWTFVRHINQNTKTRASWQWQTHFNL